MSIRNFEFKAKVNDIDKYETKLLALNPKYKGLDHQIDTYFNVQHGRLKLREGNIENSLINYDREDTASLKESQIIIYEHKPNIALKEILTRQFGIKIIVEKRRKIYFIDNVKFHFDIVENLGTFVEVEVIDTEGKYSIEELKSRCNEYFNFFELTEKNLIDKSYSDMIIELNDKTSN